MLEECGCDAAFGDLIIVTCSEKRDLRDIFMNIEILAWIDSSVYTEYNGASCKEKY